MRYVVVATAMMVCISVSASAKEILPDKVITTCKNAKGKSYYHQGGWEEDKIAGGKTALTILNNGKFDILFWDVRKEPISIFKSGGEFYPIRRGKRSITFLHITRRKTIELFTFWTDSKGNSKLATIMSRGGNQPSWGHKSGILIEDCTPIDFSGF